MSFLISLPSFLDSRQKRQIIKTEQNRTKQQSQRSVYLSCHIQKTSNLSEKAVLLSEQDEDSHHYYVLLFSDSDFYHKNKIDRKFILQPHVSLKAK